MKRTLRVILRAAGFCLAAVLWLWFWPVMLPELLSGGLERERIRQKNAERWVRRHGFDCWLRQFQREQNKRRKKLWKNRNNFYK